MKNLSDGSVELLLEGDQEELFLAQKAVEDKMRGFWTSIEWFDLPNETHWEEFCIRY